MENQSTTKCPECGQTENFIIEKSPFGCTQCGVCKHKDKHEKFIVKHNNVKIKDGVIYQIAPKPDYR